MANPKASPVSVPRVKDKHFDVPIFGMLVLCKKIRIMYVEIYLLKHIFHIAAVKSANSQQSLYIIHYNLII